MNEDKKTSTQRDREAINRNTSASATGAENRAKEKPASRTKATDPIDENRAELNGKKGNIKTESTRPTGKTSALPGAEEKEEGTAAAGAGLGGNKGTGTRNKKDFS